MINLYYNTRPELSTQRGTHDGMRILTRTMCLQYIYLLYFVFTTPFLHAIMFTTHLKEINCECNTNRGKSGKSCGITHSFSEFGQPRADVCPCHSECAQVYTICHVPAADRRRGHGPDTRVTRQPLSSARLMNACRYQKARERGTEISNRHYDRFCKALYGITI